MNFRKTIMRNISKNTQDGNLSVFMRTKAFLARPWAHREEFNRMLEDCYAGKIDLIVTKSISRFARNTVDAISTVRKLARQNPPVGVLFETENLYTLNQNQ